MTRSQFVKKWVDSEGKLVWAISELLAEESSDDAELALRTLLTFMRDLGRLKL